VAVTPRYLVDNSAWNRLKYETVAARLRPLADADLIASCGALEIEALYSSRNGQDYERLRAIRASIFTYLDTEETDWQRAMTVGTHVIPQGFDQVIPQVLAVFLL
jgi:hypothetical protein